MLASKIKKDIRASIRISSVVKEELSLRGLSIQQAFDKFIDSELEFAMFAKPKGKTNEQQKKKTKKETTR